MKKTISGYSLFVFVLFLLHQNVYAQIGHGTSDPSKASVVEMLSPSKGLLIPRVALTSLTSFSPIQGESATNETKVNSLLVYNTATAGIAPNNVTPGYYYWTTETITDPGRWNRLFSVNDETVTTITQDLYAGTFTYDNESTAAPITYNIHWKLDANDTGLATYSNVASGEYAIALGGGDIEDTFLGNEASGTSSVVSGGASNTASGGASVISGGANNTASNTWTTVSGGSNNDAGGETSTVSGGSYNTASGAWSVVSGGRYNTAPSYGEWVGGFFGTTYTPNSSIVRNDTDRLFNIGNGTTAGSRADAFTILKNGKTGIGFNNFQTRHAGQMLQVNGNAQFTALPSVTGTATDKVVVTDTDGVLKTLKAALPKFFYMPSIIIPTEVAHIPAEYNSASYMTFNDVAKTGSINLHAIYAAQFNGSMATSSTRSPGAGTLPVIPPNELNYYITWYDNTVFEDVNVTNLGILTYKIKTGADADAGSFMNIVFEVRETPSSP